MKKRTLWLLVLCVIMIIGIATTLTTLVSAVTPTPVTYTLTVTPLAIGLCPIDVNPPGVSIKAKTTFTYPAGTVVTLKANNYYPGGYTAEYKFWSWTGDLTGRLNPATITMDGNKSVGVQYMIIDHFPPTPTPTGRRVTPTQRVTPTPTRQVTSTPTRRVTPTPTRRPYGIITYYIEKVSDAAEQGPQTGQFRLWTTQTGTITADGWSKVYYTISGTATNGVDYQTLEGYVYVKVGMIAPTLPAGAPHDYIDIKPLADNLIEGTETVTITLKDVTVGAGKGSATLNIADSGSTTTPTPTPTTTPTPTPTPRQTSNVTVTYVIQGDWGNGYTGAFTIRNNTATVIPAGWTLSWDFVGDQKITNLWNGTFSQYGTNVVVVGAFPIGANGGTVDFGFNASGTARGITNVKFNGVPVSGVW